MIPTHDTPCPQCDLEDIDSLTDLQSQIIMRSWRNGGKVCIHAGGDCWVGEAVTWNTETVMLAGHTFRTRIRWDAILGIWTRQDAPDPCPFNCASHSRKSHSPALSDRVRDAS